MSAAYLMRCITASLALCFYLLPAHLNAKDFNVNTTIDAIDTNPGDTICRTAADTCSLRAAVMEANALEGADVIYLQAEQYDLTIGNKDENEAFGGDLDILDSVSIIGKGKEITTITGSNQFRIFSILPKNNSFPEVSITDMTITQGIPDQIGAVIVNNSILLLDNVIVEYAGSDPSLKTNTPAILNVNSVLMISNSTIRNNDQAIVTVLSRVTISNSIFENNRNIVNATGETGAAIHANNNYLLITSTVFRNNTSKNDGGAISAEFSDLTLNENEFLGNQSGSSDYTYGGALYLYRSITSITNSIFQINIAYGAGGAIYHNEGNLYITKSKYINNSAIFDASSLGGAIAIQGFPENNESNIIIDESIITGNKSSFRGGGIGTISNSNTQELIRIRNSQISENTATLGAGLYLGGTQTINIDNTTISGNTASESGGGIYFGDFVTATLNLGNVTIAYNEAIDGANTFNKNGIMNIVNSIISDPINGENCSGSLSTQGSNIASDNSCSFNTILNDMLNTNPLLFALADNGGSTETHALAQNSKAINNGDNSFCTEFSAIDQRYYYRADGLCDVGAFEQNTTLANRGILSFTSELSVINEQEQFVTIKVSRTGGADTAISIFVMDNQEGTATPDQDYNFSGKNLYWANGDKEHKEITIPIINNTARSENKSIFLQLTNPSNGVTLSPNIVHEITILDDESVPGIVEFSSASYVVNESQQFAYLELVRKFGSSGELAINVITSDGTARSGYDYTGGITTAMFPQGVMRYVVRVNLTQGSDNAYEQEKIFYAKISDANNENSIGGLSTTSVLIKDDDDKPQNPGVFTFEQSNYTVDENQSTINIRILRQEGTDGEMLLYLVTSDNTAEFGSDVTAINNTEFPRLEIIVPPEIDVINLNLSINNDNINEGNETLTLSILNPVGGAKLGKLKTASLTIIDDDHGTQKATGEETPTSKGAGGLSWSFLLIILLFLIRRYTFKIV